MKIVIDLMDCENKEEFDIALKLYKSLKYPRSHNNKTLDICDCISEIRLESSFDELKEFTKLGCDADGTKDTESCECDCHMFVGGSGEPCPDCKKHGCGFCTKDDGGEE